VQGLIEADDAARAAGGARVLDAAFIAEHTHGFEEFAAAVRATPAGRDRAGIGPGARRHEEAARVYMAAAVIGVYGMGLTQHRNGVQNVQMLVNLLLLRGNIGKPGAGICPVRGHSNVQGQRTVGITEKPELAPLDKLAEQYGFEPPRDKGMNTVEACEASCAARCEGLRRPGRQPRARGARHTTHGAGLARAAADGAHRDQAEPQPPGARPGVVPAALPGPHRDRPPGGGEQAVSVEDSTGCMHGSRGVAEPAADTLLSEPAIVAGIAKATLPETPACPGMLGGRLRAGARPRSPRPARDLPRLQRAARRARRLPTAARRQGANGKTPTGKANFKGFGNLQPTPTCPRKAPTCCA
jgi:hypothetical protein